MSAAERDPFAVLDASYAQARTAWTPELHARLAELRGWTATAIDALGLGWDGRRVVFPVHDATGDLVALERYEPDPDRRGDAPKMLAGAGASRDLFPAPESLRDDPAGDLWLVEGNPDAVRAWSIGLAAVAVPSTAGWRSTWAARFTRRRVVVCFDCDTAGRAAAERVAGDLAAAGIDVRLVDLAPHRSDGYDLSDAVHHAGVDAELVAQGRRWLGDVAERTRHYSPPPGREPNRDAPTADAASASFVFTPLEEFAAVDEPAAAALATASDGGSVIPADGTILLYGDGGAGKTTLLIDQAVTLAAGETWLEIVEPSRPLRVVVIENEGPRQEFRRKLERKLDHVGADVLAGRVLVLEEPWAEFTFADPGHRAALVDGLRAHEADLLVVGPLAAVGMIGGGTPDEVRAFEQLLADLRRRLGRPLAIALVHHENRAGQVSGAWERVPCTLVHVTGQGHGRTRLLWQKVRHSSALHGTATQLVWAAGESFTIEERPEVTADTIAEALLAAARDHPGLSYTKLRELQVDGVRLIRGNAKMIEAARDRLLAEGRLVNGAASEGRFELWHPDTPGAPRSLLGTGLERIEGASPAGGDEPIRSPVPPYKGNGDGNGTDRPEPETASELENDPAEADA